MMPQHRIGKGIRNHWLNVFLAVRAVITMNKVLGHHRLNILGDVFGVTLAGLLTAPQRPAAVRTTLGLMYFGLIDTRGCRSTHTLVAGHSPRRLATRRLRCLLGVRRFHSRGRVRCGDGKVLLFGEHFSLFQQREYHCLFALLIDRPSLLLGQGRPQRRGGRKYSPVTILFVIGRLLPKAVIF